MLQGQSKLPDDEICFPGNEVPEWFNHQSEGNEINIMLPQSWCNNNFLGFAFCVVVQFWEHSFVSDFKLSCQSECIFPDGETNNRWHRTWTWHCSYYDDHGQELNARVKSSHMFLFYDCCSRMYFDFPIESEASSSTSSNHFKGNTSATFAFRPGYYGKHFNTCEVQWCGVRLLYADDLRKIGLTYGDVPGSQIVQDEIRRSDRNEVNDSVTNSTMDHYKRKSSPCECLFFCSEFGGKVFLVLSFHE